jgi:hypothetical protein
MNVEDLLKQILAKLESMDHRLIRVEEGQKSLEEGQKELNVIANALRYNQEVTNAKLDALTLDVRKF